MFPMICIIPTIALAMPTWGSATRSGTYPWNGPRAMLVETLSSRTAAASISSVFDVAIAYRNTRSSSEPNAMKGLRRPHRVTA